MKKIALILFGILLFTYHIHAQFTLTDSLKAYYPFDGNANDESGNGNDGDTTGHAPIITTDRFENTNSAYSFDGIDDYIELFNTDLIDNDSLTFSIWVKGETNELYSAISTISGDFYYKHSANSDNPRLVFRWADMTSTDFIFNDFINDNHWHMLTVTYNGQQINSYVDGKMSSSLSIAKNLRSEIIYLGRRLTPDYWLNGFLDDVYIYNRPLSESEISQLYANYYPPDTLIAEPEDKQVTLSWDTTNWEYLDKVYIYRDLALHDSVEVTNKTDTSYTDINLTNYQSYTYFIRSKDDWGNMSISSDTITTFPCEIVTDFEGNNYKTTKIGDQVWMAENLKTTKYNDGTSIPLVTDPTTWSNLTTPGYCWYNNDQAYKATYGALYNWFTVNTGKLCSTNWHVPSDTEWTTLTDYLGGANVAGGKLKEVDTTHWNSPNTGTTNESGFTALPGGHCLYDGTFGNIGNTGNWWSSTEFNATNALYRYLFYSNADLYQSFLNEKSGFSVRCVKNTLYTDSLSLVALYDSTDGANWTNNTNWLTGNVSTWFGISVSGDRVTGIQLDNNNLSGPLPPAIGDLTNLEELICEWNQISGSIPAELWNLTNLRHLKLSDNLLVGTLPPEIGNLINLNDFFIYDNSLSGAIPIEILNLTNLHGLWLWGNEFTDLPDLSSLTSLAELNIQNNKFTFKDIEPNIGIASTAFIYSPQDSVGEIIDTTVYLGTSFTLSVSTGGASNQYQWKKDGTNIGSLSSDSTYIINPLALSDSGAYTCEITNTVATDLALYSHPINVFVNYSPLQQDSLALVALYDSTNGANWTDNTNWLSGPVSTWYGITVTNGRVTEIKLPDNNLTGSLPPEIGSLTNLIVFKPSANQLTGSIPTEIGNLTNLNELDFGANQFTGSIPSDVSNLTNLIFLSFASNQLTGSIPAEISILINLTYLDFNNNQLTGSIPTEIGNLPNLQYLNFSQNQLSGSLPTEISNLTNLGNLDFHENQITGSIPTEIGNLINLFFLDFSSNQLTGSIPSEIGNLTNLEQGLSLWNNQLTGSIPAEIENLTSLQNLELNDNQLSGYIPVAIGNLTYLKTFCLHNNQFTDLPNLSTLDSLDDLRIENNKFTFEDIEPNIGVPDSTFSYSPQDSVGEIIDTTVYIGTSFTLSVSTGGTSSQYQWIKNGTNFGSLSSDSTYTFNPVAFSDTGAYTCEITNTVATNLTLYSRPVNVFVDYSPLQKDSLALVALYNSTDGANWTNNTNWLTGSVSTWYGITVSGDRVSDIELIYNNLSGTIPPEIGDLTNLKILNFWSNLLTGPISPEIGNLTDLSNLTLMNNVLSGSIPSEIGNMINLQTLWLHSNNLTGSIPSSIGNLTNLESLSLYENQLSGSIPAEIGNITNLYDLNIGNNQLSGSIPPEIGNLSNSLTILSLEENNLSGPVPIEITNLNYLRKLKLYDNQLTDLPDLTSLDSLKFLRIQYNRFTFKDIEPNIVAASSSFTYSPQDSVGQTIDTTVYAEVNFTLSVSTGGANSLYQWKKDGNNIGANSSDSTYTIISFNSSDVGAYTCEIINTFATDLTLYSRPVNVTIAGGPIISGFPYSEDFEGGDGGWYTGGINTSWQYGTPTGPTINSAASGTEVWVTNLTGDYNSDEISYVISPRFNLSGLSYPKIEFSIWWNAEGFYDGANFQYKQSTGEWKTLGTDEGDDSWYNSSYLYSIEKGFGFDLNSSAGWSGDGEWGYGSNNWVTVSHALTGIDNLSDITFRIAFASNSSYQNDGVAFDDINIYDDPTGIDPVNGLLSDIQIYPNPNEGTFRLVYNGKRNVDLKLQLINLQGQVVLSEQIETGYRYSKEFDLDYLPPGIYYFRLMHKEGVIVKKMVVR